MSPDPNFHWLKFLSLALLAGALVAPRASQGPPASIPVPKVGLAPPPLGGPNPAPPQMPKATRPEPGMEPKLVFNKVFHDFGEVEHGKVVNTVFEFKNEGKGPATIVNHQLGCSCTSAEIEVEGRHYNMGDPIPVGAKGIVRPVVQTEGFTDAKETGLTLYTNDPSWPELDGTFGVVQLKFKIYSYKRFVFDPPQGVDFAEVSTSEAREASVVMKSMKNEAFQILGFDCIDKNTLNKMFELHAEPIDETLQRWRIGVSLTPNAPFGRFAREITVLTKPPALKMTFSIQGQVFGPVKTEPAQLNYLVVNKGRPATKKLYIRNSHEGHPLKITNIRLLDPRDNRAMTGGPAMALDTPAKDHISWTVTETDPGKVVVIDVIVKETMPQMGFNAVLAFDTGVPGASPWGSSEMRVALNGVVR